MPNTLYVSDLDGTLLQADASLAISTRDGLNTLLQQPHFNFTIATGRGYYSTRQKLEGLQLKLPVILSNGACITDLQTGKHIIVNAIPRELIHDLYSLIRSHHCHPMISSNDGERDNLYCHAELNEGIRWFHAECAQVKDSRLRAAHFYEKGLEETITSLTVIEQLPIIKKLYDEINLKFKGYLSFHYYENIYNRGWYWLEISSTQANKGTAIQQLCDLYDFNKNTITAFGDNHNDAPMLAMARHKIVVDNAPQLVKEMATEVIDGADGNGVFNFLKQRV